MREGIVCPRHTPGVYTTPVAFTSAIAFDLDLIVVVQTPQKQSINDAFQYVVVSPQAYDSVEKTLQRYKEYLKTKKQIEKKRREKCKIVQKPNE